MGLSIGFGTGIGPLRLGFWFHPLRFRGGLFVGFFVLTVWIIKAAIGLAILELWLLACCLIVILHLAYDGYLVIRDAYRGHRARYYS